MAISAFFNVKSMLLLGLVLFSGMAKIESAPSRRILGDAPNSGGGSVKIFDVTQYGAKGDGKKDSTSAFMQAWVAACKNNPSPAKVLVPEGNFVISPVVFQGPCKSNVPIVVEVIGTVIATSDLSAYSDDQWILFTRIENGVALTGGGTFDGKGPDAWAYINDCKKGSDCNMPTSIKFMHVIGAVVSNITSIDSKFFHFHVTDCINFQAYNLNITAPAESPNTDGIHLSDTDRVIIKDSHIGTGDDCVSVGQGVVNANITNVFCGPGHGLSIGSLGKRENEADVNGVYVTNCTLSNTDNGVRIKTFADSPPGNAVTIHFKDIIMDNVKNPIIIDQLYGVKKNSKGVKTGGKPSRVKVSNVKFQNIKGTSISDVAVSLYCSSSVPCTGIEMENINLSFNDGKEKGKSISSQCSNAKIIYKGTQNPPPCK